MGLLSWAILFFIVAVISGLLGFTRLAGNAMAIARVLFGLFLLIFLVLLVLFVLGVGAVTALAPR